MCWWRTLIGRLVGLLTRRPPVDGHDYTEEWVGQAHVSVLRCRNCDHHEVNWG